MKLCLSDENWEKVILGTRLDSPTFLTLLYWCMNWIFLLRLQVQRWNEIPRIFEMNGAIDGYGECLQVLSEDMMWLWVMHTIQALKRKICLLVCQVNWRQVYLLPQGDLENLWLVNNDYKLSLFVHFHQLKTFHLCKLFANNVAIKFSFQFLSNFYQSLMTLMGTFESLAWYL